MRLYLDTSVFGGYFDEEFAKWTRPLMEQILAGKHQLVLSYHVVRELEFAPAQVQDLIFQVPENLVEYIDTSAIIEELCEAYIAEGVLGKRWHGDAEHIAIASVAAADVIVSWNFKHMANVQRVRGFNHVNRNRGYPEIGIVTPMEIIGT